MEIDSQGLKEKKAARWVAFLLLGRIVGRFHVFHILSLFFFLPFRVFFSFSKWVN